MKPLHVLIRIIGRIVPADRRSDWVREWQSEIHFARHGLHQPDDGRSVGRQPMTRRASHLKILFRCLGALEDALWLRVRTRRHHMLQQDLSYALRSFRRQPGFTAIAVVTLALGIGANTAIFSVVRGVLLAPLPYDDPDAIVQIWGQNSTLQSNRSMVSLHDSEDWSSLNTVFSHVAAYMARLVNLTGGETT